MGVIYLQSYLIKVLPTANKKFREIFKRKKQDETCSDKLVKLDENDTKECEGDSATSTEELEVVAAIMAAISEYADIPEERLVIKSIKRVNSNASRWINADSI